MTDLQMEVLNLAVQYVPLYEILRELCLEHDVSTVLAELGEVVIELSTTERPCPTFLKIGHELVRLSLVYEEE